MDSHCSRRASLLYATARQQAAYSRMSPRSPFSGFLRNSHMSAVYAGNVEMRYHEYRRARRFITSCRFPEQPEQSYTGMTPFRLGISHWRIDIMVPMPPQTCLYRHAHFPRTSFDIFTLSLICFLLFTYGSPAPSSADANYSRPLLSAGITHAYDRVLTISRVAATIACELPAFCLSTSPASPAMTPRQRHYITMSLQIKARRLDRRSQPSPHR